MRGLLFITHQTERFSYMQSAEIALKGGCKQIQLRMKDAFAECLLETARKMKILCDSYCADLYIDDNVDVCKMANATGVHLGKNDMPIADARKILGKNFIIGGTANTFEDIKLLHAAGADYIGLGPFRFTETKKNLSPILGLSGYKDIVRLCEESNIKLPIFAIGGINIDDIEAIMQTGISGIALSSTILQAINPIEETKKIIQTININE